jgi:hypothetical protein
MDMHPVVDHLTGYVGVERGCDHAGLAVMQGSHAVEEVGGKAGASVDGRLRLRVLSVGVPNGGNGTSGENVANELYSARQFGRDGDTAQRAACCRDKAGENVPFGQ